MKFKKTIKGFTLIELLVVVSVMGILISMGVASYSGVQQRGRDTQRKSDIQQLRIALEAFHADNNYYPLSPLPSSVFDTSTGGGTGTNVVYLRQVSKDPATLNAYSYSSFKDTSLSVACTAASECKVYKITACLENAADPQINDTGVCSGKGFTLKSP